MNTTRHLTSAESRAPRLNSQNPYLYFWRFIIIELSVIAAVYAFLFAFPLCIVYGYSMYPTLVEGDYVFLQRFFFEPSPGDIVVIQHATPNDINIVKRVIATGGDTVNIDFSIGVVYVNGCPLDEPYVAFSTTVNEGMDFPLTVPDDDVFVLGDNRPASLDSRSPMVGCVDKGRILGRALVKLPRLRSVINWGGLFHG